MHSTHSLFIRGVVPGGAVGAMAPPDFGSSVNPISEEHIMPTTLVMAPPDFQNFRRPCLLVYYIMCVARIFISYAFNETIHWSAKFSGKLR